MTKRKSKSTNHRTIQYIVQCDAQTKTSTKIDLRVNDSNFKKQKHVFPRNQEQKQVFLMKYLINSLKITYVKKKVSITKEYI